jgi:hypothetical protein
VRDGGEENVVHHVRADVVVKVVDDSPISTVDGGQRTLPPVPATSSASVGQSSGRVSFGRDVGSSSARAGCETRTGKANRRAKRTMIGVVTLR